MSATIVFITGANQGLGFEVVKKLAAEQENFHIILGARDLNKGQQAIKKVPKVATNTTLDTVQIEVTKDESISAAVEVVKEKYGRIDVLHNNAGIGQSKGQTSREKLHQIPVFDVNVAGVLAVTEAFLQLLRRSSIPRIVIMSSNLGSITWTLDPSAANHDFQEPIYKASKAAVNMLGAVFSNLYAKEGIKVNLVNPGFRSTGLNNHAELAGPKEDGALEPCRVITLGAKGEMVTYTETGRSIPW